MNSQKLLFPYFFPLILLFNAASSNSNKINNICSPSSCGNIHNITYPFRLKSDPKTCGLDTYQLSCENNSTVLYLDGIGKFNVQAINYHNLTIRISDSGVDKDNWSTTPHFSLSTLIFNYFSLLSYTWYRNDGTHSWYLAESVNFIKCLNPVTSPNYLDMSGCVNGDSNSSFYSYAFVGDFVGYDLMKNCSLEMISLMPKSDSKMVKFVEVHREMAFGFELSWHNLLCPNCSMFGCYIDGKSGRIGDCEDTSTNYAAIESLHDAFQEWRSNIWYLFGTNFNFHILHLRIKMDLENVHPVYKFIYESLYSLTCLGTFLFLRNICGIVLITTFLIYKWRRRHFSEYKSIEDFLQNQNNLMPVRYTFSDIKKMTGNFKEKLGKGGFGSVYKGKLRSGQFAAVKILENSKTNGQDFINEVATIGKIHHANIVQLVGFCCERSKFALVYEFMPNGSLDKHIVSQKVESITLSWEKLYEISVGVARGIEYLHHGCEMQILHFDIKPHNILLDENFAPKISDFGLAKLYPRRGNIEALTAAQGTIGYMAPELFYKNIGSVSYKADVYSFGMLLLEITGRRKNLNTLLENSGQSYYSCWVYDQLFDEKFVSEDTSEEENKIARKLIIIGLWCIQMQPSNRPAMNKVVEMLEGDLESLEVPPRPLQYTMDLLQSTGTESSWITDDFTKSGSLEESEVEFEESISLIQNQVN
ncbi:LEAF RUST 10 DISEASE-RESISTANCEUS RECEPTOR-LIKE PROTEIN KINASE-like 2.5 [Euphorbia lathyris]|uniref:LEAF RUST 10 DISEASE-RESISTANCEUS RECEPTOR-LIKE PROTEIN KINASE-like 2.5 n=1 Tax=Euphorbia lathyris TaxID=212925 RepID=UPI003313EBD5